MKTNRSLNNRIMVFTVVRRSVLAVISKQSQHHSDFTARFVVTANRTTETQKMMMSSTMKLKRPIRNTGITVEERAKLRAVRKERASKFMADQQQGGIGGGDGTGAQHAGRGVTTRSNLATSHYIWYLSIGIPAGLLIWGFNDENSPPAQFCRITGITAFVRSYTDEIAKPVYDKLLPDWSQVNGGNLSIVFHCISSYMTFQINKFLLHVLLNIDAECSTRYSNSAYPGSRFGKYIS